MFHLANHRGRRLWAAAGVARSGWRHQDLVGRWYVGDSETGLSWSSGRGSRGAGCGVRVRAESRTGRFNLYRWENGYDRAHSVGRRDHENPTGATGDDD